MQSEITQGPRQRLAEEAIIYKAKAGLTWKAIAEGTGFSVPFVTAAVLGQHPLPHELRFGGPAATRDFR